MVEQVENLCQDDCALLCIDNVVVERASLYRKTQYILAYNLKLHEYPPLGERLSFPDG